MISIIVAAAQNGVIGGEGKLIWHISEDLKRFRSITTGHPVVMGRKTFESLGRPLPERTNVVVTRNPDYSVPGVITARSLEEAIGLFPSDREVFVIGGGEIFEQAMNLADRLYLTEIYHDYQGDTFFPEWNPKEWELVFEERHERGGKFPHPFAFRDYKRKP